MNLQNPEHAQSIVDLAAASGSPQLAKACETIIELFVREGKHEIDDANEIIELATQIVYPNQDAQFQSIAEGSLIASLPPLEAK